MGEFSGATAEDSIKAAVKAQTASLKRLVLTGYKITCEGTERHLHALLPQRKLAGKPR